MMDVLTLALSGLAALSAALCIRAHSAGPGARWQIYVFKPLATTAILLIAALMPEAVGPFYQAAIVAGLALSLLGDVCLMFSGERWFVAGLASFLLAHLAYSAGFVTRWQAGWLAILWLIVYLAVGVGMGRLILPYASRLRGPVAAYVLAILTMAWLGAGVSVTAGLGAALFVVSDGLLAYDRFVRPFPHARLFVLTTYWLAQWLIALSVRGGALPGVTWLPG
jgi:uncharacterized membrane protein YhhN